MKLCMRLAIWSLCIAAPAAAQNTPSVLFDGYDGAIGKHGGAPYLANMYGGAIEVVPRADPCGRPVYIQGVITMDSNDRSGRFDGVMTRCTNPQLYDCDHLIHYDVSVQGTVAKVGANYALQLTFLEEIWNKDSCKKEREVRRNESLLLFALPPPPPPPTRRQQLGNTYQRGVRTFWESFWSLGGLVPR